MRKRILLALGGALLLIIGYSTGNRNAPIAYAGAPAHASVPKSYGRLVAAIPDSIGTGLVFEDSGGVIRFVSITGMKEGELARYDQTPAHGGIPKSYGRLVTAVVNSEGTGLIFEDGDGVIRFVTIAGKTEGELTRN
jgi:hypothetical protein